MDSGSSSERIARVESLLLENFREDREESVFLQRFLVAAPQSGPAHVKARLAIGHRRAPPVARLPRNIRDQP